uniref:SKICH domain-containing protein n=1 Tax=Timema shepardi TaxID=629360 RepID=A0A7R9AUT4_TIMSH|nr:unnamed protein product [Timema shepardi]
MASGSSSSNGDSSKVSFVDLSSVLSEYSIPHICEISPQSLLEKSQYGKVIFHEIADSYPTDADICCRYSLTNGVTYCHGDRVSLYKVGWRYAEEFLHFEWAPGPPESAQTEFQILFKVNNLPKDVNEIYQFCYMTANNEMCGASGPFQFHRSDDNELCIVEEQDGMVVVRSRSAVAQEKLREAERTSESLQQEKTEVENKLQKLQDNHNKLKSELEETVSQLSILHTEKQSLEKKFADMAHMERHMSRLQQNMLSIDTDKNDAEMKLRKAESHIQVLTATVDTLASDKEHMSELLRTEAKQSSEMGQYKNQVESLQHMLDVLTQSKEMVAQELRVELATNAQSKEDLLRLENAVKELKGKLTVLESEKSLLLKQLDELQKKDAENARELKELHTEKGVLQKALDTAMEDSAKVDLVKQVEELKRNKDLMLSQLIQAAGIDKSNKELIAELTSSRSPSTRKRLHTVMEEMVLPVLELIQFVDTRWSSEYNMLSRLHAVRKAVGAELANSENNIEILTEVEWKQAAGIVEVLGPLADATKEINKALKSRFSFYDSDPIFCPSMLCDPRFRGVLIDDMVAVNTLAIEVKKLSDKSSLEPNVKDEHPSCSSSSSGLWSSFDSIPNTTQPAIDNNSEVKDYLNEPRVPISGGGKRVLENTLMSPRLSITIQDNVKLKEQLAQTQEELVDQRRCLADAVFVKTSLTNNLEKMNIAGKTNCRELEERNEQLEKKIVLLKSELETAKAKVAQSAPDSFIQTFSQVEDNKQELETKLKEAREGEKEQTNRLETIKQRLQEIHPDMLKTSEETSAMQMTYLTQNEELKKLKENLISLQGQVNDFEVLTEASWNFRNIPQEVRALEEEVQSTECFVESSHMRVIQLEQHGLELRQEMQVLTQQLETAQDRLRDFVHQRKTLQKKRVDFEELERQLLREHLEIAPPFQDGNNSTNDQEKEQFLNKLENSATFSQKSGSQLEEELKLRLKLAAAEYRKLYLEKQKVERRLLKLCQKLSDKSRVTLTSTGNEPEEAPIAELVNVSATEPALASSSQVKGGPDFCFICPICSVSFPPGAYDIFTEHFDNHLS